jgi:hypothetical protein
MFLNLSETDTVFSNANDTALNKHDPSALIGFTKALNSSSPTPPMP